MAFLAVIENPDALQTASKNLPAPKVSKEPLVCFALLWYNEQSK